MLAGTLILVLLLIAGFVVVLYNGLVRLKNKVNEAWADIDTQLKRRYDLIPNLVETVKGYASHEKDTLEKITKARTMAMQATTVQEKEQAENMLSGALKTIFALAENYPDLKANQNFLNLQNTLKEIEEHIQLSRRYYNSTVRDFNTKIELFPNNLIAGPLGFNKREFFQAQEEEKENVKVNFSQEPAQPAPPTNTETPAPIKPATPAEPETPPTEPKTTPTEPTESVSAEPKTTPAEPTESVSAEPKTTPAEPTESVSAEPKTTPAEPTNPETKA